MCGLKRKRRQTIYLEMKNIKYDELSRGDVGLDLLTQNINSSRGNKQQSAANDIQNFAYLYLQP
jgi:hypothetical protein